MEKDFSSVSPSARMLLLMKGHTDIPYAKEAAELISGPVPYARNFENPDFMYWFRVMHFEDRYFSINELLKDTNSNNILELSSGFSFRGLDMTANAENVHYIDTDLPDLVGTKKELLAKMHLSTAANSKLETLPLNVLNGDAFHEIVSHYDNGPITIVNEGLLMYLNEEERKQLLHTIHGILEQRGGYWITADIYIKNEFDSSKAALGDELGQLVAAHKIDENKFDSFEHAEAFFKEAGFIIDKVLEPQYQVYSSFEHVLRTIPEEVKEQQPETAEIS